MRDKEARDRLEELEGKLKELEEKIEKLKGLAYIDTGPTQLVQWWGPWTPKVSLREVVGLILDYLKLEFVHTEERKLTKKKMKKDGRRK